MTKMYGSLQNRIAERYVGRLPQIGMGATRLMWSDREAYEVVAIKDARHITVRRMKAKCIDYFAGDYEVSSDPDGFTVELFLTNKHKWRERHGRKLGDTYMLGAAIEYVDPSF